MNGRIAKSALLPLLPSRNLRALLLIACCAMSLTLLGAIHAGSQFRPDPLLAVAEAPMAEWNDRTQPLGALNEPELRILETPIASALPAGAELLRASATPTFTATPVPAQAVSSPRLRTMLMEVTAYCACKKCCGPRAQGITASGKRVSHNGGRFVAADTRLLKFNTKLLIPGYAGGAPVEVIDRGGAIKGNKLDVFFASHQDARKWGRQWLLVTVVE